MVWFGTPLISSHFQPLLSIDNIVSRITINKYANETFRFWNDYKECEKKVTKRSVLFFFFSNNTIKLKYKGYDTSASASALVFSCCSFSSLQINLSLGLCICYINSYFPFLYLWSEFTVPLNSGQMTMIKCFCSRQFEENEETDRRIITALLHNMWMLPYQVCWRMLPFMPIAKTQPLTKLGMHSYHNCNFKGCIKNEDLEIE